MQRSSEDVILKIFMRKNSEMERHFMSTWKLSEVHLRLKTVKKKVKEYA